MTVKRGTCSSVASGSWTNSTILDLSSTYLNGPDTVILTPSCSLDANPISEYAPCEPTSSASTSNDSEGGLGVAEQAEPRVSLWEIRRPTMKSLLVQSAPPETTVSLQTGFSANHSTGETATNPLGAMIQGQVAKLGTKGAAITIPEDNTVEHETVSSISSECPTGRSKVFLASFRSSCNSESSHRSMVFYDCLRNSNGSQDSEIV